MAIVAAWMRHEDRRSAHADRRADAALAVIRERESRLADRLRSEEAAPPPTTGAAAQPGSGAPSSSR
jgi:hypothetical protein